ncbi:Uncharacterised protein [Actinomyces bovis]|uniref:Uncharacterized protein n=1 Tax=Actinomyces bovis TaxID=1658 RepID=A0ABY1VLQ7_9ACTO|nr:hypothetical protein [Actinomyces bovis]SPT52422.1 Uncharacterised protein [Actinomyces bovis]VEG54054.1 Uncharacterised protein [Actinomyces israelii]
MSGLLLLLVGVVATLPRLLSELFHWRSAQLRRRLGLTVAVLTSLFGLLVALRTLHLALSLWLVLVLLAPLVWIVWGLLCGRAGAEGRAKAALWRALALVGFAAVLAFGEQGSASRAVAGCALVGVGLLLTDPANDVVAALLRLVRPADLEGAGALRREPVGALLGGGRWIGTLERLLVLVLAFSAAPAAIAAVVAAKGVIRFPEISADVPKAAPPSSPTAGARRPQAGAKAEEFLIGSFSSWGLALLAYLLLAHLGIQAPGGHTPR